MVHRQFGSNAPTLHQDPMSPNISKALASLLRNRIVIAVSIIASAYLLVSGSYLSFTATRDLHRANQASLTLERQLDELTQAVDLKSAAVNGWYSRDLANTQRLTNSLAYIANTLDQHSLDPVFKRDTLQWADESHSVLLRDLDKVKGFTATDPSSLNLQRAIIGVYETQIQLVDQLADLLRHWDMDDAKNAFNARQDRLAVWNTTWKVFKQRYMLYIASNQKQTSAILSKSAALAQQSQVVSARSKTIPRRMALSNLNALLGFTVLWILLGLRLTYPRRNSSIWLSTHKSFAARTLGS